VGEKNLKRLLTQKMIKKPLMSIVELRIRHEAGRAAWEEGTMCAKALWQEEGV
jgi:hypothetical protein